MRAGFGKWSLMAHVVVNSFVDIIALPGVFQRRGFGLHFRMRQCQPPRLSVHFRALLQTRCRLMLALDTFRLRLPHWTMIWHRCCQIQRCKNIC